MSRINSITVSDLRELCDRCAKKPDAPITILYGGKEIPLGVAFLSRHRRLFGKLFNDTDFAMRGVVGLCIWEKRKVSRLKGRKRA